MTTADVAKCSIVLFVAVAFQQVVLDPISVVGAHPEVMVLLCVAAGYVAGPERGAVFGFTAGLVADLFLPTTFGLSALIWCVLAYGVGVGTSGLVRSAWWLLLLVAAGATAIGIALYAMLEAVLGEPGVLTAYLPQALVVGVAGALVLAVPTFKLVAWALPAPVSEASSRSSARGPNR
jgi:rod shape-determining protein MreD